MENRSVSFHIFGTNNLEMIPKSNGQQSYGHKKFEASHHSTTNLSDFRLWITQMHQQTDKVKGFTPQYHLP
jgi:hypothetical protein